MKPQVRLAESPSDIQSIKTLFAHGLSRETIERMDWSEAISPYWLVADNGNGVCGALQVLVGRPIGRLDYLSLDPAIRPQARARAAKALVERGLALLKLAGCNMASGSVPFAMRPWRALIRERGGAFTSTGSVFHKWC